VSLARFVGTTVTDYRHNDGSLVQGEVQLADCYFLNVVGGSGAHYEGVRLSVNAWCKSYESKARENEHLGE